MGLNGTLQGGICTLSGLDGDASGYTIVEGSGIPFMHVDGEQTRVDWPVLVQSPQGGLQGSVAER